MIDKLILDRIGRKTIVTGHYGSGKTEFAVSLAMQMRRWLEQLEQAQTSHNKVAIIDLDIINPYFRSRERREMLEHVGVAVYGSVYKEEVTAEMPALSANIRTPLESESCRVIIDAGGNDAGAIVLNQFSKYFTDDETTVTAVVNANRPDTSDIDGAIEHIKAIEHTTGLTVSAIINNSHMLRETTADDVIQGNAFCIEICEKTGKDLLCNCYPDGIVDPVELKELSGSLMPLGLYMRPTWLDK